MMSTTYRSPEYRNRLPFRLIIVFLLSIGFSPTVTFASNATHQEIAKQFLNHYDYRWIVSVWQERARHYADEAFYWYQCEDKEEVSIKLDEFLKNKFRDEELESELVQLVMSELSKSELEEFFRFKKLSQTDPQQAKNLKNSTVGKKLPMALEKIRDLLNTYSQSILDRKEIGQFIFQSVDLDGTCKEWPL